MTSLQAQFGLAHVCKSPSLELRETQSPRRPKLHDALFIPVNDCDLQFADLCLKPSSADTELC